MNEGDSRNIVCPHCQAVNRVPASKPAGEAKCGRCHSAIFSGAAIPVTEQDFDRHLRNDGVPVVVDFWAPWCGPCKMMSPTFEKVASELEPNARFLKVNTDAEQRLAAKYGIQSIPMLMIFRDGKVAAQQAGVMSPEALKNWIRRNTGETVGAA